MKSTFGDEFLRIGLFLIIMRHTVNLMEYFLLFLIWQREALVGVLAKEFEGFFIHSVKVERKKVMKRKNVWLTFLLSLVMLTFGQGCGVYMAFTQPKPVDTKMFEPGKVQRGAVMAVCGMPVSTNTKADGTRVDIYNYYEGSASGWAAGRGVVHLIGDVLLLGLWEIVATPMEFAIRGDKITAQAEFDTNDTLIAFNELKREDKPLEKIHEQYEENTENEM